MPKKRTAGEGTIFKLPSGSWRAQVSLRGKRISYSNKSQQAVRDWVRKIKDQIDQGLTYDDNQVTFGYFMNGWFETKKSQLRANTIDHYTWLINGFIKPKLGSIRLRDLTPGKIQKYYDELSNNGKGSVTIKMVHTLLHGCLSHAKELGLIGRNPTEYCKIPKIVKSEMKIWDENQVNQFLIFIRGQRNEILYTLALATGMRRGELLSLKWSDVDWINQRLFIKRQLINPEGGGYIFQEPKTKRGIRSVQLGSKTVEYLRDQLSNVELMRKMARDKWIENDLVFPGFHGQPQTANNITIEFSKLVDRSGLPKIRFHDCRHTAASILLSRGIPPMIVAGMLGHSMTTLLTTYAHFIPYQQDEAARVMDEVVTPIAIDLNGLE